MRELISTLRENAVLVSVLGVLVTFLGIIATEDYFLCHPIAWFESPTFRRSEINEVQTEWGADADWREVKILSLSGNQLNVKILRPASDVPDKPVQSLFSAWETVYNHNHKRDALKPRCVNMRIFDMHGHLFASWLSQRTVTDYLLHAKVGRYY